MVGAHVDSLTATVDRMVVKLADAGGAAAAGDVDLPLAERGLGSIGVVTLIIELERELGIRFPSAMMTKATFATVRTVTEAVRDLLTRR